nr:integrase, catalytic region, zinc finger, CCHC-type, peptidase aspartic, catalytic [Tanacetum cinerariifolium]
MIMPSKDNLYNGRKGIGFENPSYLEKAKDLRQTLYDEKVIGLGSLKPYVPNVILEKIILDLEDEVVSLLEKDKANLKTIESLKSKGFESSENVIFKSENQSENDCIVVEKECGKVENSKVIAPGMFKLSMSQCVSPISMSKTSCESNNVAIKLKRKRRKRKSSKQNVKQVNNDVSCANSDFVHFSDLDTFSSVRRPKNSGVIWKKKGSSNTSNVDLSAVSLSKLNKNVKRYSRKDLLSCNNSHLGETSSTYVCNDAMNFSYNSRMCDLLDDNNFFIFDDESVIISPVSKMPFRKKPRDSMNMHSKSNMIKSLPRTICLWIIDSGCSKHMMGIRALLTNFLEKFLGTVRFGNNDFAVIAGYGDVVIRSMTIKKVYYIEGLGHNLFSIGQFCDKGLEVAFRKSTCFVRNKYGVDLLTGDRSSNLYTIALNKVASNSSTCLLAKASSSQSWLWHQQMASKQFRLEPGLSNLNKTGNSSNPSVLQVSETSKKDLEDLFQDFYDEYFDSSKIMKSSTTNVETLINEEVFHEVFESFQRESSSSSLNDDVQQSLKEVILPQINTQSISNNMIPNGDEVNSILHNVFNE